MSTLQQPSSSLFPTHTAQHALLAAWSISYHVSPPRAGTQFAISHNELFYFTTQSVFTSSHAGLLASQTSFAMLHCTAREEPGLQEASGRQAVNGTNVSGTSPAPTTTPADSTQQSSAVASCSAGFQSRDAAAARGTSCSSHSCGCSPVRAALCWDSSGAPCTMLSCPAGRASGGSWLQRVFPNSELGSMTMLLCSS